MERPGLLLAAVADGAGSARESQTGARMACRIALESLRASLDSRIELVSSLRTAASKAREAVLAEAEKMKLPARELACTLMIAGVEADRAAAVQIGDGAALAFGPGLEIEALTLPVESEYLNETLFLTGDNALEQLQAREHSGPLRALAMFSDGLQMLALKWPERAPHKPFFDPLIRFVESEPDAQARLDKIEKFLQSPRIVQRADDDLTLLLAVQI